MVVERRNPAEGFYLCAVNEEILSRRLPDGGPFYRETDLSHFIAEPWNGFSSLAFVIVAIAFYLAVRKDMRRHWFLAFASPVLLAGGIGGTLYHSLRISPIFLALDVIPIYILAFGSAAWFWQRLSGNYKMALAIIAVFLVSDSVIFYGLGLKENVRQSISYVNMGIAIILPLVLVLWKEKFYSGGWAVAALLAYGLGLSCRVLDAAEPALLPMGTHFLWHLCCASGSAMLGIFIFQLGKKNPGELKNIS